MKKKIFIIEDDIDILRNLEEFLDSEGYEVFTAKNGSEGLLALEKMPQLPHLIVLDLMMPIMDGFSFREQQVQNSKLAKIPILIMTATGDLESMKIKIGSVPYIRKPLELGILTNMVEKFIL